MDFTSGISALKGVSLKSRTSETSGIGQATYLYSLPEGRKLRSMKKDQHCNGSLQKNAMVNPYLEREDSVT